MKATELRKWRTLIKAGETERDRLIYKERHKLWLQWYESNFADKIYLNLVFPYVRSLIPRVYFRNPQVSVSPVYPGTEHLAMVLEHVDNELIERMNIKAVFRKAILEIPFKGTAVFKIGYGSEWLPPTITGEESDHMDSKGRKVEYNAYIEPDMPWVQRVHPEDFVVPEGTEDVHEAPWCAFRYWRPYEDIKRDPRFKNVSKIKPSFRQILDQVTKQQEEWVQLYEIHDAREQRVFITDMDNEVVLYEDDDTLQVDGLPVVVLTFNDRVNSMWGVPDIKIFEAQQAEMNDIRRQETKHRRAAVVKLLSERANIDEVEANRLMSEDVGAIVTVGDINRIKPFVFPVPPEIWREGEVIRADVREMMGFSRNAMGEYEQKTARTATETLSVARSLEVRNYERRDLAADALKEIIEKVNGIIFKHWTSDRVSRIAGPLGVPIWVRYTGPMLEGDYLVDIDPEDAAPMDREERLKRDLMAYKLFRQDDMSNPIVLVRNVLRDLLGPRYVEALQLPRAILPEQAQNVLSAEELPAFFQAVSERLQQQGAIAPVEGEANAQV